jgi:tripartite motif-containing protein 71
MIKKVSIPSHFATLLAIIFSLAITNSIFTSQVYAQEQYSFITKWHSVDSATYVYVGIFENFENNRIQKFDSNGNFTKKWGTPGFGDGQFNNPTGIAVDSSGNVYVADTENNRIQKFDSNGNFTKKWGTPGFGDGQFDNPTALTVDSSGNVYVID